MAKSRQGFAGMDPTRQREIASRGGRAAHASGNAHEFTSEEAAEAGRKGGLARHQRHVSNGTDETRDLSEQQPATAHHAVTSHQIH